MFREVVQQTLSYLRVPPDVPVAPPATVAWKQKTGSAEAADLSDFDSGQLLDPNAQRTDEPLALPPAALPGQTPAGRIVRAGTASPRAGGTKPTVTVAKPAAARRAPQPEALAPVETTVVLDESNGVPVPSFEGRTVRAFVEECMRLGLSPVPVGAGVAVEQSPPSGTRVRAGSRIVVRFAASSGVHAILQNRN